MAGSKLAGWEKLRQATAECSDNDVKLYAELRWLDGELDLRVFREDTDENLVVLRSDDPIFDEMLEMLEMDVYASLLKMEHDLDPECQCSTCRMADTIRHAAAV